MSWATTYNISHPVVADPEFNETVQYLFADPNFDGAFGIPNMQMLSTGMLIEHSNALLSESEIIGYLP